MTPGWRLAAVLPAAILAACGGPILPPPLPAPEILTLAPASLNAAQTRTVHAAVTKLLKDPESARFSDVTAGTDPNGTTRVCGKVNAKNGFGGYTGSVVFAGTLAANQFTVSQLGSDAHAQGIIKINCFGFNVAI